ncbi:MAG: DNA repair protein RecO [Oscillatoriales cyanobacterium]|nr:MAG: DNA repair protein RecO [Oscillatoriales cyanobacterium]
MNQSRTYQATGINLKGMPLGESDLLLTILTLEFGLIRAVAPGARKPKSKIGGRSNLFVVNELLLGRGRSLDRINQAQSITAYAGLSRDLGKLVIAQYWAELALAQALEHQPQPDLFATLNQDLHQLEALVLPSERPEAIEQLLWVLCGGISRLLAIAGVLPQTDRCTLTQRPIVPDLTDRHWRVGFSAAAGGTIDLGVLDDPEAVAWLAARQPARSTLHQPGAKISFSPLRLTAAECWQLQGLLQGRDRTPTAAIGESGKGDRIDGVQLWRRLERVLRHYAQYHLDQAIRSAKSLDAYLVTQVEVPPEPTSPRSPAHVQPAHVQPA